MIQDKSERELAGRKLESELSNFTGTEHYFKHWLGQVVYTDGVKYLADQAEAHWLIDAIASWQPEIPEAVRDFQVWQLVVRDDQSAVLDVRRDSDEPPFIYQIFDFTDFPLKSITLYVEGKVLLLPSEH